MRGVIAAVHDLRPLADRMEALDPQSDVSDTDLNDLQRLSLGQAVAAEAFRGLVESMLRRRGRAADLETIRTGGDE
jgi:hypothetical protein